MGSRDLIELPASVGCCDKPEASRGALKMFLGRFGLLRMCVTEPEVGLEKIGDFVTVAVAGEPCGSVGEPLTVTKGFL